MALSMLNVRKDQRPSDPKNISTPYQANLANSAIVVRNCREI